VPAAAFVGLTSGYLVRMTDLNGQSTEDAEPATLEEAAETVRRDPALSAAGEQDAATDDDARTPDTAQSGDVRGD
jgi:hypothetical protein